MTNIKSWLSVIVLGFALLSSSFSYAQAPKIGHCNLEVLLRMMPETRAMEQELDTYRQKYAERLANKEKVMQDKYVELQELMSKNPPAITEAEAKTREEELIKMQGELKSDSEKYERELAQRQETLLNPIIEKMKKAIDDVALADGFMYILNAVDASGTSIVLYGPKENDVTEKVAKKLNITLPTATPPATPAGVAPATPKN
jgi:outer membrane protein